MLTVKEYTIRHDRPWTALGIHDGWRPLEVFWRGSVLVLAALVDPEALEEREVVRLLEAGADIQEIGRQEGVELAYLGRAGKTYLFLDVAPEQPRRRITHPALLAEMERQKKAGSSTPATDVDGRL